MNYMGIMGLVISKDDAKGDCTNRVFILKAIKILKKI